MQSTIDRITLGIPITTAMRSEIQQICNSRSQLIQEKARRIAQFVLHNTTRESLQGIGGRLGIFASSDCLALRVQDAYQGYVLAHLESRLFSEGSLDTQRMGDITRTPDSPDEGEVRLLVSSPSWRLSTASTASPHKRSPQSAAFVGGVRSPPLAIPEPSDVFDASPSKRDDPHQWGGQGT